MVPRVHSFAHFSCFLTGLEANGSAARGAVAIMSSGDHGFGDVSDKNREAALRLLREVLQRAGNQSENGDPSGQHGMSVAEKGHVCKGTSG